MTGKLHAELRSLHLMSGRRVVKPGDDGGENLVRNYSSSTARVHAWHNEWGYKYMREADGTAFNARGASERHAVVKIFIRRLLRRTYYIRR